MESCVNMARIVIFHAIIAMNFEVLQGQQLLTRDCTVEVNGLLKFKTMTDDQICCDGVVESKGPGLDKDCCDDVGFYYKSESLCCEGKITLNKDGYFGCCNNQTYHKGTHFCYENRRPLPRVAGMKYCDNTMYNETEKICCKDPQDPTKVQLSKRYNDSACCGHTVINTSTRLCSLVSGTPQVIYKQQQVCGSTTIDTTRQSCCMGTVFDVPQLDPQDQNQKNPKSDCCGKIGYNPETHFCCPSYKLVLPRDGDQECCGDGSAEVCCGGRGFNQSIPGGQCCGQHLIDPMTQSCCGFREPYNSLTQTCCFNGLDQQVIAKGGNCCGGKELVEGQICCNNIQPVHRTRPGDDACCIGTDYTTFNTREKACVNGELVTRLGPTDADCSGRRYRPEEAVCCGHKVQPFPPGQTLTCCQGWDMSYSVYDNRTQMCCRGVISNTSIAQYECCGTEAVHRDKGVNRCKQCNPDTLTDPHLICCGGRKHVKSMFGDRCCGTRVYKSSRSTCCEGKLYDVPREGKQCCGQRLYNPAHEQCTSRQTLHPLGSTAHSVSKFSAYSAMLISCIVWKIS